MKIELLHNIAHDPTLPIGPVRGFTDSSLFAEMCGIPAKIGGCDVVSVSVTVVNADGSPITGAAERDGAVWRVLFAASNFATFGVVENGAKVTARLRRADGSEFITTIGVGNVEIVKGTPSAEPGDPTKAFVVKGDNVYLRSEVVEGVQHYVRQSMEYDSEIGWGANWTGDYVLVNGEFVNLDPEPSAPAEDPDD